MRISLFSVLGSHALFDALVAVDQGGLDSFACSVEWWSVLKPIFPKNPLISAPRCLNALVKANVVSPCGLGVISFSQRIYHHAWNATKKMDQTKTALEKARELYSRCCAFCERVEVYRFPISFLTRSRTL